MTTVWNGAIHDDNLGIGPGCVPPFPGAGGGTRDFQEACVRPRRPGTENVPGWTL